jgi:hypothetical protein
MGMCSPVKAACGQKPWDLRNSIAWDTSQGAQGGLFLSSAFAGGAARPGWRSCEVAVRREKLKLSQRAERMG